LGSKQISQENKVTERVSGKVIFIVFCASMVLLFSMGIRQSFGLFQGSIQQAFGIGISAFSLSLALQNLLWGVSQPFVGAIADKFGSGRVIAVGAVGTALGLIWLANASSVWELHASAGILIGIAGSGTTWAVMLSVIARNVPESRRTLFFAIGSSVGTGGQILLVPLTQFNIINFGWVGALVILSAMIVLIMPLAYFLRGKTSDHSAAKQQAETLLQTLDRARQHSGYLFLTAGFFVCGFHVMFIMAHFPKYLETLDMPAWLPGTAISTIGITNLAGTFLFGYLGDHYSKKYLLSTLYFLRAVVFAIFVAMPISVTSVLIFCFMIGFLWLATVPLTNALVGQLFGLRYLATLAGIVFCSHQLGSFTSVWLGGWLFDTTGSYDLIWQFSIALGVISALLHLPIKETATAPEPAPATDNLRS
jgi:MFS family permease|tara:strand:+ start:126 stop:1388 length:1263 start_codon:yes stop_codon:yes gene_type:complete